MKDKTENGNCLIDCDSYYKMLLQFNDQGAAKNGLKKCKEVNALKKELEKSECYMGLDITTIATMGIPLPFFECVKQGPSNLKGPSNSTCEEINANLDLIENSSRYYKS